MGTKDKTTMSELLRLEIDVADLTFDTYPPTLIHNMQCGRFTIRHFEKDICWTMICTN